ncbi:hypothetical protein [Bradyrhizobium sp.]|uniref:hypothetical protein n=1 Tax=Bradyrhizobium sp. TaxID=376 RepID=UPI0039E4F5FF
MALAAIALLAGVSPARADCPAPPLGDPSDMVVSFLKASGTQAASANLFAAPVKQGMLIYDSTANRLKYCDGAAWKALMDAGSVAGTLAGLSDVDLTGISNGKILIFDGNAGKWVVGNAPAADAAGTANEVQFRDSGTGAFDADSGFVYDKVNQRLGIGTVMPSPSAALDVASTSRGLLPPRMTSAQRTAIATPATGLVVYDTDLNALYVRTASAWTSVGSGGSGTGRAGSGTFLFAGGNCETAGTACAIDISSVGFTGTPVCAVTMNNIDATGYSEHMVVQGVTATTLKVWKGQYLNNGTTMSGNWVCVQGVGSLGGGGGSGGSAASAAGPAGAVQFNDGGAFGGASAFTYSSSAGLNVQNLNATGSGISVTAIGGTGTGISATANGASGTAINAATNGGTGTAISAIATSGSGTAINANAFGSTGIALRGQATGANGYGVYSQGRMHVTGAFTTGSDVTVGGRLNLTPQTGLAAPVMP